MVKRRKTIAVLSDSFLGEYQTLIRSSLEAFAREEDINLQFIVGRELDSPLFDHRVQNGIFSQVHRDYIDGMVILAGALSNYCSNDRMIEFCRQYQGIPMCCIGMEVPGIPSITIKNSSFSQLVEHLITVHGRTSFAFLGGPKSNGEAQMRREAFMRTLAAHNIPFNPNLEATGNFLVHLGYKATAQLLAQKQPFDALVSANDDMAIGAMSALRHKGVRVPEDVVVTGFDDLCESRFVTPGLTTMRQPFVEVADLAVSMLFQQMQGDKVPLLSQLSAQMVRRTSCGCAAPDLSVNDPSPNDTPVPAREIQQIQLEAILLAQVKLNGKVFSNWAQTLVAALFEELDGHHNAFALALRQILASSSLSVWIIDELHTAIGCLRANLRVSDQLAQTAENIWHHGRTQLFDFLARRHVDDRLALLRTNKILVMRSMDRQLAAPDSHRLLEEIVHELLTVGVQNGVVSIFTHEENTQLKCVVAIQNGDPVTAPSCVYPARQLLPDFMVTDTRHSYVVFSLSNGEDRLGILALEGGTADSYYEMLSEYLSANIRMVSLYQDQQQHLRHEARERQRAMELQHRQKLESLGILAGGIAHDFNNMLSVMSGNLDVIHLEMEADNPSMEPLQECRNTVQRASGLVRQLLSYSGKGRFLVRRVNINTIVSELKEFLKMAVSRNVALVYELSDSLPDVEADTAQLHQVFVNLVINASDAIEESEGQGRITVQTFTRKLDEAYFQKSISSESLPEGNYVIARISDTGIGIAPQIVKQIFDPFYTTKFGGRGLGLAAVLGIIRGHRGAIHVESEKGKGTVFELSFPQLPTGSEQPRAPASRPSQIGAGTILIVDDEKAVLKAGSRLLRRMGFSTLEAQNGQQAIDLVQDFPNVIHCVLMDITMPGIGGIAAMSEIRKINPKIPVVLTSGYSEDSANDDARPEKADGFLQKPYNLESVSAALELALNPPKK
ncbi:MAG: substrate-binding domain-containing protein [Deltaproteobacteria bacterium]|nr:substrate-binding domain-containing protein [Deltaproteobacteria bacterium]